MKLTSMLTLWTGVAALWIVAAVVTFAVTRPAATDPLRPALRKVQAEWQRDAAQCRRNGEPLIADALEDAADRLRFTVEQHPDPARP